MTILRTHATLINAFDFKLVWGALFLTVHDAG